MQLKKLVLLIDFHGHPQWESSDHDNNLRYAHLREMMFRSKPEWIIMSDHHPKDFAIQEIRKLVKIEGKHPWIDIDYDELKEPCPPPVQLIEKVKRETDQPFVKNNIIIGGCNTAGCVLDARCYSAVAWAKLGWHVKIHLPLCADYQKFGTTAAERNMFAYAAIDQKIKSNGLHNSVTITAGRSDLEL